MKFHELRKAAEEIGWEFHDHAILGGPIYYAYPPKSKKRTDLCFNVNPRMRHFVEVSTKGPGSIKLYLDKLTLGESDEEAVHCMIGDDIVLAFYNFNKKS